MYEDLSNFITFDYNTIWNMHSESSENMYQNTVLLDIMQDNEPSKEINTNEEKSHFEELNNFESDNILHNKISHNTSTKQDISILNKTHRTVPNILKSSSRSHKISEVDATKPNCFLEDIVKTEQQVLLVPDAASKHIQSENTFVKEAKYKKVSRRRKQKFSYVNAWNICSFVDKEKEVLDKNICMSTEIDSSTQKNKLKHYANKQNKRQGISILKSEQERLVSSMSQNVLTDCTSKSQFLSSLEEIESNNFQDSIDFSSNEIFNTFYYESYDSNKLDFFIGYTENSDDTYNSFSSKHSDYQVKELDMNYNEIDTYETMADWSLTENEQDEIDISIRKPVMSPDYWIEDLFSDRKSKCSCCDYSCYEDYAPNLITTSEINTYTKDRLSTEIFNDDSQANLDNTDLYTSNSTYVTDNVLSEDSSRTCSPLIDIESSLQITDDIDSTLIKFFNYSCQKDIKEGISKQFTYTQEQEETLQIQDSNEYKHITEKNEFQCSSCLLSFASARTMAIHQAAAHGGMYIILCESCGRLFNRKYHFNRHFIHCHRMKEPFNCDMCFRKYRHKSSLLHHLKVVHQVHYTRSRSSTFTCKVCQKVYSKFGAFENHVKTHKNAW
ncbi:asparagine-rich zinc finger protein AZF1-like isoform X1 [Bombus pyrosoma]|uniref:asparagine-rich zinc finger protein AZF1-like isoform X1 n=2 Tax=Bombus pyrosoma TaxID=396416 RepID=UPI001CB96014|nr:asparagine-rich zinc finger protein AZF1-like isoform X1 [Bombus pyrosoma]